MDQTLATSIANQTAEFLAAVEGDIALGDEQTSERLTLLSDLREQLLDTIESAQKLESLDTCAHALRERGWTADEEQTMKRLGDEIAQALLAVPGPLSSADASMLDEFCCMTWDHILACARSGQRLAVVWRRLRANPAVLPRHLADIGARMAEEASVMDNVRLVADERTCPLRDVLVVAASAAEAWYEEDADKSQRSGAAFAS